MSWLDKFKPKKLSDFKSNLDEIKKATTWIEEYKKNPSLSKKVLLIIGNSGVGKTCLANIILKEYNYNTIELNSSDSRSQKKISEFLIKSLTYKNVVDMFNEGKTPIAILIDEIDTICKLNDKGGFSEFLTILKQNEKFENKKKNKVKISVSDYIKLYNPIICTSSDINDKKINELKKFSEVIHLKKNTYEEDSYIIEDLYKNFNQEIDNPTKLLISDNCQGDNRRLILLLQELYFHSNGKNINTKIFNEFIKYFTDKEEDVQLIYSTRKILSEKIDINTINKYYDVDCLLMPLMLYHNSINYIKNTEDVLKKKINVYKNILESLSIQDTIQTNIFELQDWDELYNVSIFYSSILPNYYFTKLKNKKDVEIQFTSLLNKISQMFVNKKLLNSAKVSIGKINYDSNQIIYLTEIISHLFDEYKNNNNIEGEEGEDEEDENKEENKEKDLDQIDEKLNSIPLYNKKLYNNTRLINFMNNYNMSTDGLENLLKVEKLNKTNEKRKKKFTLKIKKDLTKYLITSPSCEKNLD